MGVGAVAAALRVLIFFWVHAIFTGLFRFNAVHFSMVKHVTFLLVSLIYFASLQAQSVPMADSSYVNDTIRIPHVIELPTFTLVEMQFDNPQDRRDFLRTRRYVNNVMPYARQALDLMDDTDQKLEEFDKRRHEKRYIKSKYKELKFDYETKLKDLYVEEGRILIKIIERKTGMTFFEVVKKYKGWTSAVFWNTVANLNGYSLKDGYDPDKEEYLEMILTAMEEPIEQPSAQANQQP